MYHTILQNNLLPLIRRHQSAPRLLQDNAPVHYTPACRNFYANSPVNILAKFPPYSPDLNPIENWWSIAQTEVRRLAPTTMPQLRATVQAGLQKVTSAIRRASLRGMPGRLRALIDLNGGYTGH
jgi:transposase